MTVASSPSISLGSQLVNGLLSVRPLANFAKQQARSMMIKRAESIGVNWRAEAQALRDRGSTVWEQEYNEIRDPALQYPDYYLTSFHAYETGNLSWDAATEVEVAAYAAHAKIWSDAGAKEGDARLRASFHQLLQAHFATLGKTPRRIVDLGCSVGMSTFALQAQFPQAGVTGVDLSPYFLAVAQYRDRQRQAEGSSRITWLHQAAEATQLPPASVDLVSTFLMCHELPQAATRQILREARRLLPPGGTLAIMDMNPQSEMFKTLPPYVLTLLKSTEPYLDDYFSLDLSAAMIEAGFNPPTVAFNSPRHRTLIATVASS
jgi:ubiquinone/menaquinone biosynthesis C-methylase UbiE